MACAPVKFLGILGTAVRFRTLGVCSFICSDAAVAVQKRQQQKQYGCGCHVLGVFVDGFQAHEEAEGGTVADSAYGVTA
jgi:hypothetical protein